MTEKYEMGPISVCMNMHYELKLSDGTCIALKAFYPQGTDCFAGSSSTTVYRTTSDDKKAEDKYPAVLEYIPYRKADKLAERDFYLHTWLASYGYVVVRADLRGSGDSTGVYFGEYLEPELNDGYEIIEWLASQKWCTGKVGIFGKSWGGFNGLQIASMRPPSLAAVIAAYVTDDRYAIDVHYDGGCVVGSEMLSWSTYMFALNAVPPDPRNVSDWKNQWERRLREASAPWVVDWLRHQTRDDFWKHGSVCEDYSQINIPTLVVGGWRDSYRDPVLRLAQHVDSVCAIMGPWSHQWPHLALPGPQMDFLRECLRWWDYHLKGISSSASDSKSTSIHSVPKVRIFARHSEVPQPFVSEQQGHWIERDSWPPRGITTNVVTLTSENTLLFTNGDFKPPEHNELLRPSSITVPYHPSSGQSMGEWLTFGAADGPLDQREEDSLAACFTSDCLPQDIFVLGFANFRCQLVASGAQNIPLVVRLCDVFPDGTSSLITYGVLNLSHRHGHGPDTVTPLVEGEVIKCTVELHCTAYVIPKGHCLRLAMTTNYWPMVWPAATIGLLRVRVGRDEVTGDAFSYLEIPTNTLPASENDRCCHELMVCANPANGLKLPSQKSGSDRFDTTRSYSYAGGKYTRTVKSTTAPTFYPDLDVILGENYTFTYTIDKSGPQSATAVCDKRLLFDWPKHEGGTKVEVDVHCVMRGNEKYFDLDHVLKVTLNGAIFFEKSWHDAIDRFLV